MKKMGLSCLGILLSLTLLAAGAPFAAASSTQVYRDEVTNISFEIPADWTITEAEQFIFASAPEAAAAIILQVANVPCDITAIILQTKEECRNDIENLFDAVNESDILVAYHLTEGGQAYILSAAVIDNASYKGRCMIYYHPAADGSMAMTYLVVKHTPETARWTDWMGDVLAANVPAAILEDLYAQMNAAGSAGSSDASAVSGETVTPVSSGVSSGDTGVRTETFPYQWAIYWYMCGSDLESEDGWATDDLREMLAVTLPDDVIVVIEAGGAEEWQNALMDPSELGRYVYFEDELYILEPRPLASMGDPDTLVDFLTYCNETFPAERQMLLMWDHGGGSLFGMNADELHEDDHLTLPQLRAALEAVPAASGLYEVIGFDACLMGTLDIVDIVKDHARYLVASEEVEPCIGWDYTGFLSALAEDTAMDGARLGRVICDTYAADCRKWYPKAEEITLSVIDLSRADALLAAFDEAGDEALLMAVERKEHYLSAFGRAAMNSQVFGDGEFEMVDLGDLLDNAAELLPQSGQTLRDALDACVVYQVKGEYRSRASGLACYYNYYGSPFSLALYRHLDTNKPFSYYHEYAVYADLSEEARDYVSGAASRRGVSKPMVEPLTTTVGLGLTGYPVEIGPDGHWQLNLGPDLSTFIAEVFVKLMYVSVGEGGEGFRVLWGTNRDLRADYENGVYTEDFKDSWGSLDGMNMYMEPIGIEPGRISYAAPFLLNSATAGTAEWNHEAEYVLHVGYLYDDEGNETYEILGAWKTPDERGVASKTFYQLQPGDIVEPLHTLMLRNENGEWEIDDPPIAMGLAVVTEDTQFYTRSVGDGYFALFFEMIDYAGNHYYSDQASFRVRNG